MHNSLVVLAPTHPEKYATVKLDHETPGFGCENKKHIQTTK